MGMGGMQLGTAFSKSPYSAGGANDFGNTMVPRFGSQFGSDMGGMTGDAAPAGDPSAPAEQAPVPPAASAPAGGGAGVARSGSAMLPGLAQAFASLTRPSDPYQPPAFR
jgi:hypothetical protein